jgi:hypothetical protein
MVSVTAERRPGFGSKRTTSASTAMCIRSALTCASTSRTIVSSSGCEPDEGTRLASGMSTPPCRC